METSLIRERAKKPPRPPKPGGVREVLSLAIPIMLSFCTVSLIAVVDRLCLSWYDRDAMNAAFQAGSLFWTLAVFPNGIGTFVNSFVSQYEGAGQSRRVGAIVWQGVFVGVVAGVLLMIVSPWIKAFFIAVGQDETMAILERKYWTIMTLGAIPIIAFESLASFFEGLREPKYVTIVSISGVALNALLDPILIFGLFGFPELGLVGAATASSISMWAMFVAILILVLRRDKQGKYGVRSGFRFVAPEMRRLMTFGSMSAAQGSIEHFFFGMFTLMMGWISVEASASTAIGFNINSFLYMPAIGLGLATSTLVGNSMGAGKPDLGVAATRTAVLLAIAFSCFFALLFLVAPEPLVDVYALNDPEAFASTRPIAINVVKIVGIYLVMDALNLVLVGALRGAGDARFIMVESFVVVALALIALFVGVHRFGLRVYWCWWVMTGYLIVNVAVLYVRFLGGKWKEKSLVDAPLPIDSEETK